MYRPELVVAEVDSVFGHISATYIPFQHVPGVPDHLQEGQSIGVETGGQLRFFAPILLEYLLVLLIFVFVLCDQSKVG